jgi:hypothetical protein
MKLRYALLCVLALVCAQLVFAQGGRYDTWAVDSNNHFVASPTVRVCSYSAPWNSATAYVTGNTVTYNGGFYTALASSTNVTPGTDGTKWQSGTCSPLASVYADKALTVTQANPFTGDSFGNYGFFALPGTYTAQVNGYTYSVTTAETGDSSTVLKPIQFSGVDLCAKISSAFAWAISQGWTSATVDARQRTWQGTQNCAASPFAGVSNNGTFTGVLLTQGTRFVMSAPIIVPGGIRWDGHGSRSLTDPRNAAGTSVQPSSTYATTYPLNLNPIVQYGLTADTSSPQKIWLQNLAVSCLAPSATYVTGTGSTAIYNGNGQEGSGGDHLDIMGCQTGIAIDVASVTGGAHSGFDSSGFRDSAITVPSDAAAVGIQFGNTAMGDPAGALADVTGFEDITVTGAPVGTEAGTCVNLEGSAAYFKGIRCYYTSKGFVIGNVKTAVALSIDSVDTESNSSYPMTTVMELDSHAGYNITISNVHVGGTTTNILTDANYPSGACAISDPSDLSIGFYSRGVGGGANGVVLSTSRTACTTTGIFTPLFATANTWTGSTNNFNTIQVGPNGTATSSANFPSFNAKICNSVWNGTAATNACGSLSSTAGSGTNPSFFYKFNSVAGAAATNLDLSSLSTATLAPKTNTATNCNSSASPAVCSAAAAGTVAVAAGATTEVVNTTAVTSSSEIHVFEDSSLGTRLGVTCNTTTGRTYTVTARTSGTSFTITSSAAPSTNPACLSYTIFN